MDQVQNDLLTERLKDALLFGSDLQPSLIDLSSQLGPFRDMEGPGRLCGLDISSVSGDAERVSYVSCALNVTEVAKTGGPAERQAW